jgi:phenylalanyl-tRNA synthetase beta chain
VRIPFEWLKEFVVIDMEPHELAARLTMRGFEVEAIEELTPTFDGVVVGTIASIDKHPKADNLSLCKVDIGREILSIVCGAKNISPGDRVPVATVGGRLGGDFLIEKRPIRGVDSFGMLCSEKELGLSDDHSGIFILPDDFAAGGLLADMPGIRDVVLDINVPPNRGDCLSVYGMAREAASILRQKAKLPVFTMDEGQGNVKDYISLDIKDIEACPRYVLRMITDISIVPSPFWMRNRILKCGMRPINSIVDVTNYVMLELGQPLHSFDYGKLRGKRIEVRLKDKEMKFRTLDGQDRDLDVGDTLICDGEGPVAIAGIMGGENSEIGSDTKDVALESAYFNPLFIRRTARRLGIRSEASLRFEKGIDVDNVDFAGERAIFLMNAISGGTVVRGKQETYERSERKTISVSFARINEIVGTPVAQQVVIQALQSIDVFVVEEKEGILSLSVPLFRHDIVEYMDIIEEVARIYGFDHIPPTMPVITVQPHKRIARDTFVRIAKDYLTSAGFFELINFSFAGTRDVENFFIPDSDARSSYVSIMNPLSKDYAIMRTIVAPGVLKNVAYNINRGARNLRFFEMGKVFISNGEEEALPHEYPTLCFIMTGREREYFWREKIQEYDFFDIKGVLQGLMDRVGLDFTLGRSEEPFLNRSRAGDIIVGGEKAGWIGELRDEVLKEYEIEQKVYCAELRFDIILAKGNLTTQYEQIPRYPQVARDFSFFVDDTVPVSTLVDEIKKVSPLIKHVGIFDMFKKETRSIALRVVFQSFEDTLKDETVNDLQDIIIEELTAINGVTLRS